MAQDLPLPGERRRRAGRFAAAMQAETVPNLEDAARIFNQDRLQAGVDLAANVPAPVVAALDEVTVPEPTEARQDARLDDTVLPWTEEDERQLREERDRRRMEQLVEEMGRAAQRERGLRREPQFTPVGAIWRQQVAPGVFDAGMGQTVRWPDVPAQHLPGTTAPGVWGQGMGQGVGEPHPLGHEAHPLPGTTAPAINPAWRAAPPAHTEFRATIRGYQALRQGPNGPEWVDVELQGTIPECVDKTAVALEELSSRLTAIEKRLELIEGKGEVL